MQELSGKGAFVTGAASGIGLGMARRFVAEGMRVALVDVEERPLQNAVRELEAAGGRVVGIVCDVSKFESVEAAAGRAASELGSLHLACNNAGVLLMGSLDQRSHADWDWVLSVNLKGVINGIQAFVPRLLEQGDSAHIVNTASLSGLVALPGLGVYTTSKYAVVGLSESLRADLAPHGIGVSVLCPGGVRSRIVESERNRPPELGGASAPPPEALAGLTSASKAVESMMEPSAVAEAVLDAVRADELYIVTHAEWKGMIQQRFDQILAAFDAAARR